MVRHIRVLDQTTVNKIAAGEVVESPSSVVKELVENSIDAFSNSISVHIDGGGIRSIQVTDDGLGMSRDDAQVAFTRHSTSKISRIEDLDQLSSLGFRGEALASIAAVSQVTITTRVRGGKEEDGTRVVVSAGRMLTAEPMGCPEGTTITVKDLFENVPARKRFLRSERSERTRCMDVVNRLALCHPNISFKLNVDGEERLNDRAVSDHRNRVAAVLGVKTAKGMMEIPPTDCGSMRLSGLISLPWDTRSNSGGITLSVGGRVVKNRSIIEALRRGYGSRLMKGRFPLAVLMIEVDPSEVDVNVHPTKDLVKFSNEGGIIGCVESTVGRLLFGSKRASKAPPTTPSSFPGLRRKQDPPTVEQSRPQSTLFEGEVRAQSTTSTDIWSQIPNIDDVEKLPPALPENAADLKLMIIGQLDRSYILCELGSDLLLVDQHAAHERIRLEMFKRKYAKVGYSTQELLEPIHIELDPASSEHLLSISKELVDLGFMIEDFGSGQVVVRGLPQFLGRTEAHVVLKDIATGNEYHEGCTSPDPAFTPLDTGMKDRVMALSACRGAIMAHKSLSLKEMEDLLKDLFECDIPLHCAHGRPTMIRLPISALEKWFRRVL